MPREIDASELALMLQEGFTGEVDFEGRVFTGFDPAKKSDHTFYEARGKFKLLGPTSERKEYTLSFEGSRYLSSYLFAKRSKKVDYADKGNGHRIVVPIDLNERAFLRIDPEGPIVVLDD